MMDLAPKAWFSLFLIAGLAIFCFFLAVLKESTLICCFQYILRFKASGEICLWYFERSCSIGGVVEVGVGG
jgi:hypothetical protein